MFSGQSEKPKGAKQTPSAKAGAERRQRQMISVRQKAHGELMKHVRGEYGDGINGQNVAGGDVMNVWAYNSKTQPEEIPLALLPEFVRMVIEGQSDDVVLQGALMIRKLLCVEKNPPHDAVVQTGVLPYLANLMDRADNPQLQFEAAWALTNVVAGTTDNVNAVIGCGAIPRFVALLSSEHADCREQGAWAIGNMAGDGVNCRDAALRCNAVPALLSTLAVPDQPLSVVRNAVWAVSNLCRWKPSPPLESVSIALPVLCGLLHHPDQEVVTDASWAISYISDGPEERVQAAIDAGVVPHVVKFLSSPCVPLQTSAVRIIGNIASGNDLQTQVIINCGALPVFVDLLTHRTHEIRKEACWTISNIAAGSALQIDALATSGIFPIVIKCLGDPYLDVRKEAVWSIANVTMCGNASHIQYLLNSGVIPPLCGTLESYEGKILVVALEALQGFLKFGEEYCAPGMIAENLVAQAISDCGGIDAIERLQTFDDNNVYRMALYILETFFNAEDGGPCGMVHESTDLGGVSSDQLNGPYDF